MDNWPWFHVATLQSPRLEFGAARGLRSAIFGRTMSDTLSSQLVVAYILFTASHFLSSEDNVIFVLKIQPSY